MSYNPAVPNQANAVRGGTGDLLTMQGNFDALAPLVSAYLISGAVPSSALLGFLLGLATSGFQLTVSGDDLRLDRISGGSAQAVLAFSHGGNIRAFLPISGQAATSAFHLVPRSYVDALTVDGLADTTISAPATNEGLVYSGGVWRNRPVASAMTGLSDVVIFGLVSGHVLRYNGVQWENAFDLLSGLSDVSVSGATIGHSLVYSGGGVWIASGVSGGGGGGDILANGTVPFTGTISGIYPTLSGHLATKGYVDTLSGLTISGAYTLSGLTDVDDAVTSSAVNGEVLTFSGGAWYNKPATGGTGGGADILQVQIFS
jgi:hypothetical protein